MANYPYMLSCNKIPVIIEKLQSAAKPEKFTQEFLKNLGFNSSNDRALVPLLKKLEFITEDGIPTAYYDKLRDKNLYKQVLAQQVRILYADLFTINTRIYEATDENIKGSISRVTGSDASSVNRMFNTFKILCSIADFNTELEMENKETREIENHESFVTVQTPTAKISGFHYDIQIHLPATTDISVYNAIFRSLKDNLLL